MDTPRTLLQATYEMMKVYAPGVPMSSADAARGLAEMNMMLDEWSNEKLTCYANVEQSFVLQPGVNSYTIGAGGVINLTRPLTINTREGSAYLMDTNANRYPIDVIEQDKWNLIGLLTESSNFPNIMFYDPQYPLGIINVFPQPTMAYTVYFDSRLQLADMANLDTSFSLPPGYSSAIKNNMLIRLWSYFKSGDPTATQYKLASDSLSAVKRTNIKQSPSTYDSAVVSKAQASYNIYSDTIGRGVG